MVKIQKLYSGQLVLTIPKRLAEYEGLKRGMEAQFKKHKDLVVCFPVVLLLRVLQFERSCSCS